MECERICLVLSFGVWLCYGFFLPLFIKKRPMCNYSIWAHCLYSEYIECSLHSENNEQYLTEALILMKWRWWAWHATGHQCSTSALVSSCFQIMFILQRKIYIESRWFRKRSVSDFIDSLSSIAKFSRQKSLLTSKPFLCDIFFSSRSPHILISTPSVHVNRKRWKRCTVRYHKVVPDWYIALQTDFD